MRQLVGDEAPPLARPGRVPARPEHHAATHGASEGADRFGRRGCLSVAVDPDVAKIVAEPGLEEPGDAPIERLARPA